MSIGFGSNIASLRAQRRLAESSSTLETSYNRLSSGMRINTASDDAAGLSVATSLAASSRVYTQGVRNLNDGLSLLSVADGAVTQLKSLIDRQKELALQSANGTLGYLQRKALDKEFQALGKEYNRILDTTKFNNVSVFSNSTVTLQGGFGTEGVFGLASTTLTIGDGTFSPLTTVFTASTSVGAIKTADFNGDGRTDVAVHSSTGGVTISLSNGDGTFRTRTAVNSNATTATNGTLAINDFNGDGFADLALSSSADLSLRIALGNGDGTFRAEQTLGGIAVSASFSVESGDFNGDGKMDLVVGGGATASIIMGNGDGTFGPRSNYSDGVILNREVVAADINGDNILDLMIAGGDSSSLNYLLGNSNGTFRSPTSLTSGSFTSLLVKDLDGDGIVDITAGGNFTSSFTHYKGLGNGSFATGVSFAAVGSVGDIVAADINKDNIQDLVVTAGGLYTQVFLGNGDGSFQLPTSTSLGTGGISGVGVADFNGDGVLDMVAGRSGWGTYTIYSGRSTTAQRGIFVKRFDDHSVASLYEARKTIASLNDYSDPLTIATSVIGANMSRLSVGVATLADSALQYKGAEDRISSVDIASEASRMVAAQVRQQAAAAVLANANVLPSLALKLLSGV